MLRNLERPEKLLAVLKHPRAVIWNSLPAGGTEFLPSIGGFHFLSGSIALNNYTCNSLERKMLKQTNKTKNKTKTNKKTKKHPQTPLPRILPVSVLANRTDDKTFFFPVVAIFLFY